MLGVPVSLAAALFAALTSTSPSTIASTEEVAPGPLAVNVVTVNGSGCPGGSASVSVSADGRSFRVTFGGYSARTGSGADPTDFRQNCQFNFQVQAPDGYTYAVSQADYSGFARLDSGVTGVQGASYYFQGESPTIRTTHEFTGPFNDSWQATDRFDSASLLFAPCGAERNLNVNTELRVEPETASTSLIAIDPTIRYQLTFKSC